MRHYWLSRGLAERGWDVRLIRCGDVPTQPGWRPSVADVDNVEVTTVPGPPPQARGVRRVAGWVGFSGRLQVPRSTQHLPRPDVVIGSAVHLGAAWAAQRLARRHGVPFVFEVRDLWPETLIAMGAVRRQSPAAVAMLQLERSLARSADLIVSPLSGVGRYMKEYHGIPESRFVWVSNGVNCHNYVDVPDAPESGLRLQYFGAIGKANDVGTMIRAVGLANRALEEPISLQVRGVGALRHELMEFVANDGELAPVVTFPPEIPAQEVPSAMSWGNAVILVVRDLPELYRYGISMNKLFDYLASGRWIVMGSTAPDNPIASAPGLTLTQPSAQSLSEALVDLSRMNPADRNRIARGNATLAKAKFDYSVLAGRLDAALDRVLVDGPDQ